MTRYSVLLTCAAVVIASPAFAGFQWTPPAQNAAPTISGEAMPPSAALPPIPVDTAPLPPVSANPVTPMPTVNDVPRAPQKISDFEKAGRAKEPIVWSNPTATAPAPVVPQNIVPPTAARPESYEEPITQTNAIRPIRIDTRTPAMPTLLMPQTTGGSVTVMPVETTEKKPSDGLWSAPANSYASVPAAPSNNFSIESRTDGLTTAEGFGHDIPLMMAVSQIVPSGFGLAFDQGVKTDVNVTWEGGKSWLVVLNAALQPHKLRAELNGHVVRIRAMGSSTVSTITVTTSENEKVASGMSMVTEQPQSLPVAEQPVPQVAIQQPPVAAPVPSQAPTSAAPAIMPTIHSADAGFPASVQPTGASFAGTEPAAGMDDPAPVVTGQMWTAQKGMSLRETLESWTAEAGVQLYWSSDYDYPLAADVQLQGSFEQAIKTLLNGFADSRPKPTARLHPNLPNGPAVLVVETRDTP